MIDPSSEPAAGTSEACWAILGGSHAAAVVAGLDVVACTKNQPRDELSANKFEEARRFERIRTTVGDECTRSQQPVVSRQPIGVGCPGSRIVASSMVSG